MTTTNGDTRSVKQLKSQITSQNDTINMLRGRINTLSDDITALKAEISAFQNKVQVDMTTVFEGLKQVAENINK